MGNALNTYDRQLIMMIEPDLDIRALRKAIVAKNPDLPTDIVWTEGYKRAAPHQWEAALPKLTQRSRLYLLGHGSWQNQSLGGMMPGEVCALMAELKAVKLISCLGCASARTEAEDVRISLSNSSFVTNLHKLLKTSDAGPHLKTVMFGRVFKVAAEDGSTEKKVGDTVRDLKHHRAASKVRLSWDGDRQKIEWVEYAGADEDDEAAVRRGAIPNGGAYLQ